MSEIRATTISDAAGTGPITLTGQSAAKAWVNFNGTGTVALRDSENVSSLTDNGTGNYTVNFSNSFSNTSYSGVCSGYLAAGNASFIFSQVQATSSFNLFPAYVNTIATSGDDTEVKAHFMGDLA